MSLSAQKDSFTIILHNNVHYVKQLDVILVTQEITKLVIFVKVVGSGNLYSVLNLVTPLKAKLLLSMIMKRHVLSAQRIAKNAVPLTIDIAHLVTTGLKRNYRENLADAMLQSILLLTLTKRLE